MHPYRGQRKWTTACIKYKKPSESFHTLPKYCLFIFQTLKMHNFSTQSSWFSIHFVHHLQAFKRQWNKWFLFFNLLHIIAANCGPSWVLKNFRIPCLKSGHCVAAVWWQALSYNKRTPGKSLSLFSVHCSTSEYCVLGTVIPHLHCVCR